MAARTEFLPMDGTKLSRADIAQTLMLQCPTCGSDASETLGVTGAMNGTLNATVIMQCDDCSTVYLSPRRDAPSDSILAQSPPVLTAQRIKQWIFSAPSDATVLCVDCSGKADLDTVKTAGSAGWSVESIDSTALIAGTDTGGKRGRYDLVLMLHSLESASEPAGLLQRVSALLADDGKIVVVVANAGSSCFAAFRGRHWSAYRFPQTLQHFTRQSLEKLGRIAGLSVVNVSTATSAESWRGSIANWLRDWGFGNGAIWLFAGRWFLPKALAAITEGIAQLRGRGAILIARFANAGDLK